MREIPTRRQIAVAWGATIRQQRIDLGMTQTTLSRKLDVSQVSVSSWELGRSLPTVEMQAKIIDVLGIGYERWYAIQREATA